MGKKNAKSIKINLNKPILDLDGTPMKDSVSQKEIKAFKQAANALGSSRTGDAVRLFYFATKMYDTNGVMTLEGPDYAIIKKTIADCGLPALIKGQLIEMLDDVKEVEASKLS